MHWNDAKFFLAVHRAGSYAGATAELGVDATTVGRRMSRLEEELGVELFRRRGGQLELTAPGKAILEPAQKMERAAQSLEMSAMAAHDEPGGRIRLGSSDAFAPTLMTVLAQFRQKRSSWVVELCSSESLMDLGRARLDMSIRFGAPGRGVPLAQGAPEVVRRKLGALSVGLFASRGYLERAGTPARFSELMEHRFVLPSSSASYIPGYDWCYGSLDVGSAGVMFTDKILTCAEAATQGIGIAALPTILEKHYELTRILPDLEIDRRVAWLVIPKELRRVRRIRELADFLRDELGEVLA